MSWVNGEFNNLHKITALYEYSATNFKEDCRNRNSAIGVSSIILDFDEGTTLKQALEIFGNYYCLIVTSKSHQLPKNSQVVDRFRVILLLNISIIDMNYYSKIMKVITRKFGSDIACTDSARQYYPNPNQEVYYTSGKEYFDITKFNDDVENFGELVTSSKTVILNKKNSISNNSYKNRLNLSNFLDKPIYHYYNGTKQLNTLNEIINFSKVSNKAISCHCFLNDNHPDIHNSCFIYHNDNNIYAKCMSCGYEANCQKEINYGK
jgi:hypothetical protein